MDKEIVLSVIIPVYNAAQFLSNCLDSILTSVNNTNQQIEIILINDGSQDNSLEICYFYQNKFGREKCIILDKDNSGPSDTRNLGMQIAKGEYLCFIDSDDFVDINYFSALIEEILTSQADMVFIPKRDVEINGEIIVESSEEDLFCIKNQKNYKDFFDLIIEKDLFGYIACKAIKKSIITSYNLKLPSNIKICEDLIFTCKLIDNCQTFSIVPYTIYNYIVHQSSLSRQQSLALKRDYELSNEIYFEFLNNNNLKNKDKYIVQKSVHTIITYLKILKKQDFTKKEQINELKWIMECESYGTLKNNFRAYRKYIIGLKKWPLYFGTKYNSLSLFKLILKII